MLTKINHVTVYDGRGKKEEDSAVVFEGRTITAWGQDCRDMPVEEEIDGRGLTVMPGWINSHVHIALDGKPNMQAQIREENTEAQVTLSICRNCLKTLASGIVTIRDMGTNFDASLAVRDSIAAGRTLGPRIFTSGRVICMTGGHGSDFGIEADGADATRRAARTQIKKGVDLLKIMATGGGQSKGMSAGATQLTENEIAAIVEEGKKAGLPTAAHAQGKEGVMNCLRAGVGSIEHGVFLDGEQAELMAKNNTFFCATLLPPYYVVRYGEENGIPPYVVKKCAGQLEAHFKSFELAVKSGLRIIAGNDAGTPFNNHDDMVNEYKMMAELGMPVRDIITATTYTAAQAVCAEDRIGSIKPGKLADFTVVEGDPEQDIDAFGRVRMVFKEGKKLYALEDGRSWFAIEG